MDFSDYRDLLKIHPVFYPSTHGTWFPEFFSFILNTWNHKMTRCFQLFFCLCTTPIQHSFPNDNCKIWILSLLGQRSNGTIVISEYLLLLILLLIGYSRTIFFLSL